jgi:methyltransferase
VGASSWLAIVLSVLVIQRGLELRLAARNEAWARSQGAVEHGARHYPLFFALHGGWMLGWIAEAIVRGPTLWPGWAIAMAAFASAQALRYWAIASLGRRWNTRILVLPGAPRIRRGPYGVIPHPNYLAVCIELAAVPAIFGAWITAAVATVLNAALLLLVRIPAENAALHAAEDARRFEGKVGR